MRNHNSEVVGHRLLQERDPLVMLGSLVDVGFKGRGDTAPPENEMLVLVVDPTMGCREDDCGEAENFPHQ